MGEHTTSRYNKKNKVMKANEMPKKIYLFDYNDAMVTPIEGDTVYVREDAFIEKASRWIEENICEYCEGENIIFTANNTQYIDILNQQQFIEDFKKYMEGE